MESAKCDRTTVVAIVLTAQAFAQNLQLQPGFKKSISALTYPTSMHVCSGLQNSSLSRNAEKSYLKKAGAWRVVQSRGSGVWRQFKN
jgi:hypothetical protein